MRGKRLFLFAAVSAAGLTACSEHQSGTPTSPELSQVAGPACSYNQIKQDINAEWPNSVGGATKDTNTAVIAVFNVMQGNQADSNIATTRGFQIIQSVAIAASTKQAGTTAAAGSKLVLDLFPCMDVPPASVPSAASGGFVAALGASGAFGVRARTNTDTDSLDTHDGAWTVGPVGSPWATVAARDTTAAGGASATNISGTAKDLFLIWGQPADQANFTGDILLNTGGPSPVFAWNTTPQQTFNTPTNPPGPGIQITECVLSDDDIGFVQQNAGNAGVILATAKVTSCASGKTAYLRHSPNSLFQKLRSVFTPEPAYALAGSGSSTKGSHLSRWGVVNPGQLKFLNAPTPDKQSNQVGVPLRDSKGNVLSVTPTSAAGTSFGQSASFVWVEAINNQGTNVVACNNWAYTDASGKATFTNLYLNKSGGYTLTYKTLAEVAPTLAGGGHGVNSTRLTTLKTALFNVKNGTPPSDGGCSGQNVFIFDPNAAIQTLPPPPGPPPL